MSGNVTLAHLRNFFQRVGQELAEERSLYLIGGAALRLLGSPRTTLDVDYVGSDSPPAMDSFDELLRRVARETRTEIEAVPLPEFLPLPEGASERHQLMGKYGISLRPVFDCPQQD